MAKTPRRDPAKLESLREHGTLNPHPEKIADPLFKENDFFDPRDLVQVKYEMLRRARVDKAAVSQAASSFGFSRVSFYQAQATFEEHGLPGLLPGKRGPREAHKLTPDVLAFINKARADQPRLRFEDLARKVARQFGTEVHPRSVERALARSQKKRR